MKQGEEAEVTLEKHIPTIQGESVWVFPQTTLTRSCQPLLGR